VDAPVIAADMILPDPLGAISFSASTRIFHLPNPHKARVILSRQNAVGKPLADNGIQHATEAASVVRASMVVPKRLFTRSYAANCALVGNLVFMPHPYFNTIKLSTQRVIT
jgi:hypothetical protein